MEPFKFNLKIVKKDIFETFNKDQYTSKTVTGRINKICRSCGKSINPGETSVTHTRKTVDKKKYTKYITYHTCYQVKDLKCMNDFLGSKFIL